MLSTRTGQQHKKISLPCNEKNELVKQINVLKDELSKQGESLNIAY